MAILLLGSVMLTIGAYLDANTWLQAEPALFAAWLMLMTGVLITLTIFTALLGGILYRNGNTTRYLLLSLATADIAILSVLFVLEYIGPAYIGIGAGHHVESGQLLVLLDGFVLLVALTLDAMLPDRISKAHEKTVIISFILVPLIAAAIVWSPLDIPSLTSVDAGLNPLGMWILAVIIGIAVAVFLSHFASWLNEPNVMNTSVLCGVIMFCLAIPFINQVQGLFQTAHLIALTNATEGVFFVAVGMIFIYAQEQHASLLSTVEKRTEELATAKDESDFYLYLWSHEVANLLQGLVLFMGLIEEYIPESEETRRLNGNASALTENIMSIVRRVSEMAQVKKAEKNDMKPIEICTTVHDAVALIERMKSHHLEHLEIDCDNRIDVIADELLKQVFVNLLKNSLDHCDGEEPRVKISVSASDASVVVDYEDRCPELPQNVQDVLFDKFTPSSRGFGLGLFIIRKLMARYDGRIRYVRENGSNHFLLELNPA